VRWRNHESFSENCYNGGNLDRNRFSDRDDSSTQAEKTAILYLISFHDQTGIVIDD
jgi:hypothetical protein